MDLELAMLKILKSKSIFRINYNHKCKKSQKKWDFFHPIQFNSLYKHYYSNLSASIGCNSAAFFAGQIQDTIQIIKVRVVAKTTTFHVIEIFSHSILRLFIAKMASQEKAIAISPQIAVTTTDSIKN